MKPDSPIRTFAPDSSFLLVNDHYLVERMAVDRRTLRITRTAEPFTSKEEIDRACGQLMEAIDRRGAGPTCALVDSRLVQGRNDPAFEVWFEPYRRGMLIPFTRAAIVVRTMIGKLQCDRLLRNDGHAESAARAFVDEETGVAWLLEVLAPAPPSSRRL